MLVFIMFLFIYKLHNGVIAIHFFMMMPYFTGDFCFPLL